MTTIPTTVAMSDYNPTGQNASSGGGELAKQGEASGRSDANGCRDAYDKGGRK